MPLIIVGNREDIVMDDKLKNETLSNLVSLKNKKLISDYVIVSAQQIRKIEELTEILRQTCPSLLSQKEKFMVPQLYEVTAKSLQKTDIPLLIGN